jgi:hypothetical protein
VDSDRQFRAKAVFIDTARHLFGRSLDAIQRSRLIRREGLLAPLKDAAKTEDYINRVPQIVFKLAVIIATAVHATFNPALRYHV